MAKASAGRRLIDDSTLPPSAPCGGRKGVSSIRPKEVKSLSQFNLTLKTPLGASDNTGLKEARGAARRSRSRNFNKRAYLSWDALKDSVCVGGPSLSQRLGPVFLSQSF